MLGDFGIVFLPNLPERIIFTNKSVGSRDFMPPWIFLGELPGPINPAFDVYMLGKVLWCMVSRRLKLHREDFRHPLLDLTNRFAGDPQMYAINLILERCVVAREEDCLSNARELLHMAEWVASMIQNDGPLLEQEVPRPCHVCGRGQHRRNS